jgi:hypothetical protein
MTAYIYEGCVQLAGGEVLSSQCNEERCQECPQLELPPGEEADRNGPLAGYHCECGCHSQ